MKQHATDAHTLSAAYALGALDSAERAGFEDHLRECDACRQEATEFRETAARLAAAVSQAPPVSARTRVMAAVEGVRQLPPRLPAPAAVPALGVLRRKALPLALAAGVAAAVLGGATVWQSQHAQEYERQARQSQRQLDAVSAVLAASDARTVHGRAANGAFTTVVASSRRNAAVFTATGLPAPAAGRTYQLWLDHDGTMRPAGFIDHDGTVVLSGDPADAGAVGLTLEPAGGSARPTTTPLLLMALPA
ncbi:anti-sigma factor domain-containing protein [Streptomyces sp. NPDC057540]|uniref:anti-sigma factor n=1 Tax=Streptomyces sp. NPDC057540 TaxID=3346160 RepID=UPI0036B4D5FF